MTLAQLILAMSMGVWAIDEKAAVAHVEAFSRELQNSISPQSVKGPLKMGSPLSFMQAAGTANSAPVKGDGYLRVGSVAIVDIWGVLMKAPSDVIDEDGNRIGTSYQEIRQWTQSAMADEQVKTVLMRFDSPGGAAIPVETPAAEIFAMASAAVDAANPTGKPIIAIADSGLMASAAYYMASQASAIYSTPGALTGSIGTRMDMWNITGLLDRWGIKVETIKSTASKDTGSPYRPMSEQDRAILQKEVASFDAQFVSAVMRGRGVDQQTVNSWQKQRVFMGQEAMNAGLIDGVVNSLEQLVGMLNGPAASRLVRGKRMAVMARAEGTGPRAEVEVASQKLGPESVPLTAGIPAEGHVAKLMLGIAGVAAGLALLDPLSAGGGSGGGAAGGSGTAAASGVGSGGAGQPSNAGGAGAVDLERTKAETRKQELERVNAIMAAALPFAGNEAIQKTRDEAISKGWTVDQFNAAAMKSLAPATLGPGPEQVGNSPTPVGVRVLVEEIEMYGAGVTAALQMKWCSSGVAALQAAASGTGTAEEQRRGVALAKHWGAKSAGVEESFETPSQVLANLTKQAQMVSAGSVMNIQHVAMKLLSISQGVSLEQVMARFNNPYDLFTASIQMGLRHRLIGAQPASAAIGLASTDLQGIVANLANKELMASFAMAPTWWEQVVNVGPPVNDFKPVTMYGISELGKFVKLTEFEPISESRPIERKEQIAVSKFGRAFSWSFEAFVNNDIYSALMTPQNVGRMAAFIPQDLVLDLLSQNSRNGPAMQTDNVNLFNSAHGNLGSATALSYAAVRAARLAGRKQLSRAQDPKDREELGIELSTLLVHTDLSDLANSLNTQEFIPGTDASPTNLSQRNDLRGRLRVINSGKLGSSTEWYMFTPVGPLSALEVRFLFGQRTPTIQLSPQSDMSAMRYDAMVPGVGAAARSWEGAYRNPGA